jgi:putative transposase
MELKTRRAHFAACTPNPNAGCNRLPGISPITATGSCSKKRYVLMDRDSKFCPEFRGILKNEGVKPLLLPPRSPDLNSHIERFRRSIKSECLERMIFFGEKSLRRAIKAYLEHFHAERNHQGLDNQIIEPADEVGRVAGQIECQERLGGTLRYYCRKAA